MNVIDWDDRNPATEPDRYYEAEQQYHTVDPCEHRLNLIAEVAAARRAARERFVAQNSSERQTMVAVDRGQARLTRAETR